MNEYIIEHIYDIVGWSYTQYDLNEPITILSVWKTMPPDFKVANEYYRRDTHTSGGRMGRT